MSSFENVLRLTNNGLDIIWKKVTVAKCQVRSFCLPPVSGKPRQILVRFLGVPVDI
jgi:hypothetical protein